MISTAILTACLTAGLILTGVFILFWRQKRQVTSLVRDFLVAPDAETPSQFAVLVDQMSYVLASRIVTQVKTTVMGMNSVDAKNEQKLAVSEALSKSPGLAAAIRLIPGARRLMKSPELLGLITNALSKAGTGNKGNGDIPNALEVKSPFQT